MPSWAHCKDLCFRGPFLLKSVRVVPKSVKNVIFDLGGVILDLSVDHTIQSFAALSGINKSEVQQVFTTSPGFNDYETGAMDDAAFRNFIRNIYSVQTHDNEIDRCWNAMLRGIPVAKLELLTRLKNRYNVFLLSNTNNIHLSYINNVMIPGITGERSLEQYFHKAYYSHRMGMRKPDAKIYQRVLDENNLLAEQTLFLDDNKLNVEGANSVGIKTVYVTSPDHILEYFHD